MSEEKLKAIADNANMVIAGYSYTLEPDGTIRVLNLEKPEDACVLNGDGEMLETTMDDTTLAIAQAYFLRNKEFMEVEHA